MTAASSPPRALHTSGRGVLALLRSIALRLLPQAIAHARRGRRIVNQNIVLSLLIIAALPPLAITGVLGLAAVVLIHEVAEVLVILNGLRAARTRQPTFGR